VTQVSPHFSWAEVTRSDKALALKIDNALPLGLRGNAERIAALAEEARAHLGGLPLHVNSWYRCPALNKAVGSNGRSVHPLALAIDFEAPAGMTNREAFLALSESTLLFDQLIHERTDDGANWIHLGLRPGTSRRMAMLATGRVRGGQMNFSRIATG